MDDESGQTLIEFAAMIPIIALVISGTGWLLRETNRRTECSRLVFEAVRARLEGVTPVGFRLAGGKIRIVENGAEGELKCGPHTESLFLPKIDRRKPGVSRFPSSF